MSVRVSTWAWGQSPRGNRKLVLIALADQANDSGCCWPGQEALAAKCGLEERALRDHIKALEADGYIKRERRHRDNGARTSDRNWLLLPADSDTTYRQISGDLPADSDTTYRQISGRPLKREPSGEPSVEPCRASGPHVDLCRLLADLILARDPKAKTHPDSERWLTDMRLLVERDDRSVTDVERVIRWCQADGFWAPVILSPGKLRQQFPTLWGQMNRPSNGNGGERRPNASDLIRKLQASEAS
jgi:DNA-binding Lrp family transcriptional regulator